MKQRDTVVTNLTKLLQYAFTYQLAVLEPFAVSNTTNETSISNDEFNKFSLRYISSNRLDFDGGIGIDFLAINEFGVNMLKLLGHNSLTVNVYNLESTDGEFDLEIFHINIFEDCERIMVSLNLNEYPDDVINQFNTVVEDHINSDAIDKLRTFAALMKK